MSRIIKMSLNIRNVSYHKILRKVPSKEDEVKIHLHHKHKKCPSTLKKN